MYNKLFTKILDSSIWLEPLHVRVVWITLIASMDEDSYCHFSAIENLARRAGVTVPETEDAVNRFLSPDPNSGDPDNEGRRVERIPGGFLILNGPKYRVLYKKIIQREQTAARVRKHRCNAGGVTAPLHTVTIPSDAVAVSGSKATAHQNGGDSGISERTAKLKTILCKEYNKPPDEIWTYEEEHLLCEVARRPTCLEDFHQLKKYRASHTSADYGKFPRSATTLLQRWPQTLDAARSQKEKTCL